MRLIILLLLLANVALGDGVLGITNNTTTLGAGPSSGPQLWGTNATTVGGVTAGSTTNLGANSVIFTGIGGSLVSIPNTGDGRLIFGTSAGDVWLTLSTTEDIQMFDTGVGSGRTIEFATDSILVDGSFSANGGVGGPGSGLTSLNASQLTSGVIPDQVRYPLTNFTTYAAGTAYTLTGSSAALDFGTTDPVLTINQAGTYLIHANVGVKYSGATYVAPQTVTFKLRRTNNTAADLTNGSRAVELPVLTTFTGGDTFSLPPIVYAATSGDSVTIFGILSATPSAGSVLADSAEIVALRIY